MRYLAARPLIIAATFPEGRFFETMWAVLLLSMTVTAAKADDPVKLALPGFNFVKVEPELAGFFSEHFAQKLTFEKVKVTTAADVSTRLGFERKTELLG